jgi:serine/threonine protein kinase
MTNILIPGYKILEKLGKGNYGTVYSVKDKEGKKFAAKSANFSDFCS